MKTKMIAYRTVAVATALSASLLSSCKSDGSVDWTTTGMSTAGGAVGAGAAYGVYRLFGGNNATAAALIAGGGALLGSAIGYAWGKSIVRSRSEYATSQEYVNDNKKQMNNRISDARRTNAKLKNAVSTTKKNKQKISAKDKREYNAELNRNLSLIDQDISNAKLARSEATGSDKAQLSKQISELQSEKSQLKQNKNDLSELATI